MEGLRGCLIRSLTSVDITSAMGAYKVDQETAVTNSVDANGDETVPARRRRRSRTTFTVAAIAVMEEQFGQNRYPDIHRRESLAELIGVSEARVQVWFQNRRARSNRQKSRRRSLEHDHNEGLARKLPNKRRKVAMETKISGTDSGLKAKSSATQPANEQGRTSPNPQDTWPYNPQENFLQFDPLLAYSRIPYLVFPHPRHCEFTVPPLSAPWLPGYVGNYGSDVSKPAETDDFVERLFRFSSPAYQKGRTEKKIDLKFPSVLSSRYSMTSFPVVDGFNHDSLLMQAPRLSDARDALATDGYCGNRSVCSEDCL